jgi:pSer/pThr/pTyr-binding forkhead associated (FHA) protein
MNLKLILFKKNGSHKSFTLPTNITVIGRRHDCDLQIPLMPVSRRHCQLSQNEETVKVRDLGSRNGTYLNGKRIEEATVEAGDYIKIGPLTFLLQVDGQPEEIVPPEQAAKKAPAKKEPAALAAEEELDIFPELDEDASDSFLADLEDL